MVQSKISYIIYTLLSMPFFLFVVRFKVIFGSLAKTLQLLKKDSLQLFKILFQSMPLHATDVNTYLKMSCTKKTFCGSTERLHTKTLRQFSKIQDKNPFVGPFLIYCLKTLT